MSIPNSPSNKDLHQLLLLATSSSAGSIADETALHFYTGITDLIGLQASLGCEVQKLWACAEWIRLLFDANAIWIRDPKKSSSDAAGDIVSEVASLTAEERNLLRDYLWTTESSEYLDVHRCGPAVWLRFRGNQSLGDAVPQLKNSNLANTQSLLRLKIKHTDVSWEIVLLLPGSKGCEGKRVANDLCSWVVGDGKGNHCSALVAAFRSLPIRFHQRAENHKPFWSFDREELAKNLSEHNVGDFIKTYKQRLWAIDGLLDILQVKLSGMVGEMIGDGGESQAAIFSYRMPNHDYICFLPTASQASVFVKSKDDIADFTEFFKFQYPRDRALSGWVLSTAMCDYTENFDSDGRWTSWKEGDQAVKDQLGRVGKFLQGEEQDGRKELKDGKKFRHVYLVPIMTVPRKRNGRSGLETILMVSISVADPLPVSKRRQIFRLSLELRAALDLALDVQRDFDEKSEGPIKTRKESKLTLATIGSLIAIAGAMGTFVGWAYPKVVDYFSTPKLRLAQNPIALSALTIVAKHDGDFANHNLVVDVRNCKSGLDALLAVENGDSDIATVAETPVVLAAFQRKDIALIATMATSNEEMELVVRTDKIHSPRDLKGKTLGVTKETNAHYFLYQMLAHNQMTMNDVTLLPESPQDMAVSFSKGMVDGYSTWQPFADAGLVDKALAPAEYSGRDFYTMTLNIVTSKKYLQKHLTEVENFVWALKDAEEKVHREPDFAKDVILAAEAEADAAKSGGEAGGSGEQKMLMHATLDKSWPNYVFKIELADSLLKGMEDQRSWVTTSGAFGYTRDENPDFCNVLDSRVLKAIDPGSVSIRCKQ